MSTSTGRERPGAELVTWLAALRTLSALACAETDLAEVLCLVADTARTLLGFDFCGVLIPGDTRDQLLVRGWSGLSDEYVGRVNSDRPIRLDSTSPSSRAFHTGEPVAIRDVRIEPQFALWAGVAQEQGYRAIIAVPLIAGAEVLGTLNGYYASVHTFTRYEVERLTLLANHAAIAVTSARRLDELRTLTNSLREQRDALARSEQIHERLLAVTLRSGGIAGIAAALSDLIGRPVLIDDARQAELARSGAGIDYPAAAVRTATADSESAASATVGEAVDSQGASTGWLVARVRLGSEVAARIWFPGSPDSLDPLQIRAVEHASIVISVELLRVQTAAEVERRVRGELLTDVLTESGPPSGQIRERAQRLGHDLTVAHVAVVATLAGSSESATRRAWQRALSVVTELASGHQPRPLVAMHGGTLVALWPETGAGDGSPGVSVQRELSRLAPNISATVAVSPVHGSDYGDAYQIAKSALEIAVRSGRTDSVVTLEQLGIVGLLLQLDDPAKLTAFADRTLAPVVDYDARHRTDLIATLRTHFACKQDRTATAEKLLIHPNTVAQRLRRIESLCGVDLADPTIGLQFSSALIVYDIAEQGHGR
ncbi:MULTISPECIES: GAF domain-containing protein [unclassified Mycobacterium]|uniref:helix-turn-helix domain-containing protein n=1 Tax=unclassified Mycobacterium TaxID=2642494 RepID=UPI00049025DA|nr:MULTISPECIES: GAF domain-containing protein [unclassified Mycobacterium]SEB26160.1 Sugar diacid utilization regulator [Mycobacterium sp. 283mftsu]